MESTLFYDRKDAAQKLVDNIKEWLIRDPKNYEQFDDKQLKGHQEQQQELIVRRRADSVVVLAVPRGGVVIGDVIASALHAKLDIVISRKIGAPENSELAIGAVMPDGSYFLHKDIANMLNVSQNYIDQEVKGKINEIQRRLISFRGSREYDRTEFDGKIIILVDDGIATGATILAAAQWIKQKQQNCKALAIAVPVAPPKDSTLEMLNKLADKLIVLCKPEPFYAVGRFYQNFEQVSDEEVKKIMKRHGYH